jgi:hypothetical protein
MSGIVSSRDARAEGNAADYKNPALAPAFHWDLAYPIQLSNSALIPIAPVGKRTVERKAHHEENLIIGIGSMDDP